MTTSEQWRKIGELFDALVELDAGERNRRLQALRQQDPELAREVATLLAADDNSHPLLDGDAAIDDVHRQDAAGEIGGARRSCSAERAV